MADRLDVQQFVRDYRVGVKDRDLIAKYKMTPKEMLRVVKKLISDGRITRDDYFNRNKRIQDLEARQEKVFLSSLHHCPVCSHVHPTPFTVCPACGSDAAASAAQASAGVPAVGDETQSYETEKPTAAKVEPGSEGKIGLPLEGLVILGNVARAVRAEGHRIGSLVSSGPDAAMFESKAGSAKGQKLLVKIFDPEFYSQVDTAEFLRRVIAYQAGMEDTNILRVIGTARVGGDAALVYEHLPTTLESLVSQEPQGLPLDLGMAVLPQILNAVGYSHMHRGTDGVIRRLSHMRLALSKFLFDPATQRVKLDECGAWRALVDVRGYKSHLWEETGVDLAALGPECFVLESRSVNGLLADMYALGVTLYQLVTGDLPFRASTLEEYRTAHLKKFPIPPRVHNYTVPKWLDRMILKCLEKEPSDRWRSATQMEITIGKDYAESA